MKNFLERKDRDKYGKKKKVNNLDSTSFFFRRKRFADLELAFVKQLKNAETIHEVQQYAGERLSTTACSEAVLSGSFRMVGYKRHFI